MNTVTSVTLNNPKVVRAWYMYDWANSVYALVISSAIFPIYFKAVAVSGDKSNMISFLGFRLENSVLYSYALSISFLIVAAILPLLSGMADYTGKKKFFMKVFVILGSFSCMGLYFFDGYDTLFWGLFFSVMANIGYSGSLVFYDAFLPEIVSEDRYDMTSARGYAMGYYGSIILMMVCIVLIQNHSSFNFSSEGAATRFSFFMVGLWWLIFSFISFRSLPDNPYGRKGEGKIWVKGYEEVAKVWRSLKQSQDLKRYLLAFFFYNMGVQTIMYLAALFGTDVLNLPDGDLIKTILLIQIVGAFGAWGFAKISARRGNKNTLLFMIMLWVGVCIGAYFVAAPIHFYILAFVVGLVMGGIQSLSRATYSKLIPKNTIDHASYFSFYDVTYNISIVVGTFSYGFIDHLTGSMRYSALGLALYFFIGLIILSQVKSKAIQAKTLAA